ncbi:flagellar biosynthesis protein FlhB [bacterium DOLZORAL124_64_63]|nr:MAG: flagellar biosynthesis protein FlhB [bacterium DOLZORAL124_64_63]
MADDSAGEKTEKATGKRREDARKQGQVAKSEEVNGAILLIVGMTILVMSSGHFARVLGRHAAYIFSQGHILNTTNEYALQGILRFNIGTLLTALAPLLAGVFVSGIGANILQVGFKFTPESLQFKLEKLNPLSGFKKYFKKDMYVNLIKNIIKVTIICLLAWGVLRHLVADLNSLCLLPLQAIISIGKMSFIKLMAVLLAFTSLLAIIDWFWTKHRHEEEIKMSKQEIKQENKDVEGDPQIKARIKSQQFEMARKRMLADVPTADVVITNPTHFAVALKYVAGQPAPMVVAKGQDNLAQTIKKIARKSRVPIIENKPLARSLYRQVEVGQWIPESLFQAVAEVLAYIYRLKKS